ncbi:CocE/NonD family hydrolase [Marinobacter sediminum]|uniref:CocE/NonD family hydrolase n=1 Tax=Marinobacter sediminum TaxID=256323 RepID=UPI0019393692|nr:CocE/NonD family hydrolase [Marinobacter sediminum]
MRRPYAIGMFTLLFITLAIASELDEIETLLGDLNLRLVEGIQRSSNIMVPMRDGVRLATNLYLPVDENERYPVIYIRTTYGGFQFHRIKHFVNHGYAVIVQHVRGRFASEGRYESPYWTAGRDGYDTIDWVVSQPWSNGKVGTFGCSYLGESQIILAAENHPNHIAMIASGAGGAIGKAKERYGYFGVFENGVLNLASSLGWFTAEGAKDAKITQRPNDYENRVRTHIGHLPVSEVAKKIVPYDTGFDDLISRPLTDPWWDQQGYIHPKDQFSVATLHINDWFDQTAHNTFKLAEHMAENAIHPRAKSQHVLIAPGLHCTAGKLDSGPVKIGELEFTYTNKNFSRLYIDWFDYWLKDKDKDLPPRYEYFLIHSEQWHASGDWPPPTTQQRRFYLLPNQHLGDQSEANRSNAAHDVPSDQFVYDPLNPVPTAGGPICCTYRQEDRPGPLDQTALKSRQDVLVYTSNPLDQDLDVVGNARVVLFVSTSAKDTDFTVKMVDQYPDGKAYNLQDGVVRLRYRNGIARPSDVEPGRIYRIELEMRPIAYRFKQGHKVELHISSSNFPRLARNLNTGNHEYNDSTVVIATNQVYLDEDSSSYVELPVMTSHQASSKGKQSESSPQKKNH